MRGKYNVLDLFAGAGGFSAGFATEGDKFNILAAVEINEDARETFKQNFPGAEIFKDIRDINVLEAMLEIDGKYGIDVIIGGFPCKAFSCSGYRDAADERGHYYLDYLRYVNKIRPRLFLMENVKGLLSFKTIPPDAPPRIKKKITRYLKLLRRRKYIDRVARQRPLDAREIHQCMKIPPPGLIKQRINKHLVPVIDVLTTKARKMGYLVTSKVLNSVDYGTPQERERLIISGVDMLNGITFEFPEKTCLKPMTAKEAIDDLKNAEENAVPNHVFTSHGAGMIERLAKLKHGESLYPGYKESWKRLYPDRPAYTIKENHSGVHVHYAEPRTITPREMARFQDVPDDFVFTGGKTSVRKQVGNMIPLRLSRAIALQAFKTLDTEHPAGQLLMSYFIQK